MKNVYEYRSVFGLFNRIKDFRLHRKWARQRAKRGFCDADLWEIHTWFIEIMPDMLEKLADTAHSYPQRMWDEYYATHKDEFAIPDDVSPQKLRTVGYEYYLKNEADEERIGDLCFAEWQRTLRYLAHLFREANPETCSKTNPVNDDYCRAHAEFEAKYGEDGRDLRTPEQIAEDEKNESLHSHFMSEVPEFRDVSDRYFDEKQKIDDYQDKALHEGLDMFVEYFYDLWD